MCVSLYSLTLTLSLAQSIRFHQAVVLTKDAAVGLGITISGGKNNTGAPQSIFITSIHEGGLAESHGVFERGDIILEVNSRSFEAISHDDAVRFLKTLAGTVELKIARRTRAGRGSKSADTGEFSESLDVSKKKCLRNAKT